ncbi:MAG TPA: hypothetical protein VGE99_05065 [Candidatus Dormibacteraeota bacterium]
MPGPNLEPPIPAENDPPGAGATGSAPEIKPWQTRVASERRRKRRRAADRRQTLGQLTVAAAVAAVGLNAALFLQTGVAQLGPAGVDRAILSIINVLVPGTGLRPPAQGPSPSLGRPVVTTGGS